MDGAGIGEAALWAVLIPVVGIIGGITLACMAIYAAIRRREFEHRERLAMIEKGIMPEKPPRDISNVVREAVVSQAVLPSHGDVWGGAALDESQRAGRLRRGGVIVIALGIGLFLMIWLTSGETRPALGVGAFLFVLGGAIFLSSYFRDGSRSQPPAEPTRPGTGSGD